MYASVFDDVLIHVVIEDMGGWKDCAIDDKQQPFVAKEFQDRYRGYIVKKTTAPILKYFYWIIEGQNSIKAMAVSIIHRY